MGIYTYLMTRALGALGRTPSGLASGIFGAVDGGMMTGAVITSKTLSLTFFAMDTMAFRAAVSTLCTNSSLYSIACPGTFARKPFGQACHRQGELVQPGLKVLTMHQLYLFGHALCPQSQDLPTNQPVIIIIMAGLLQQNVVKGFPCHSGNMCALQYYQGFAHPCYSGYHQGGKIWVDVTIQLNQLSQWDSAGQAHR